MLPSKLTPEQKLVQAVLLQAIHEYCGRINTATLEARDNNERAIHSSNIQREDSWWLKNRYDTGPFSFLWCCEVLNISPDRLQLPSRDNAAKWLHQMKEILSNETAKST